MIKLKLQEPNCKFRLEHNLSGLRERLTTSNTQETGLKAPEMCFVELNTYQTEVGEVDPASICYELIDGVSTAGVAWSQLVFHVCL